MTVPEIVFLFAVACSIYEWDRRRVKADLRARSRATNSPTTEAPLASDGSASHAAPGEGESAAPSEQAGRVRSHASGGAVSLLRLCTDAEGNLVGVGDA